MHDFVVVGCGPAGSRFARRAAERGYDVLAFEQGEVGEPLACSGHVSTDVWEFTPDGARDRLLQNVVYGARFHLGSPRGDPPGDPRPNGRVPADRDGRATTEPDGAAAHEGAPSDRDGGEFPATSYPFYKDEQVSNVIDRVGLDRELADAARDAGVDLREHHTVVGVSEFRDRVEIEVRGPDGVETHEARMVAGCDGPKSRVRRELDMPEPDELLHGVLGFSDEDDASDFVDVHLTVPDFFAWRIPRGEAGVEYGLATPPSADVRERFDRFTADYGVETDRRCSGLIPVGPPDSVTSRRAFLVGDAAAQTKPFTGGGIRYGMTAADHAAREVDPRDPATLSAYEAAWRDDLEREIELGHWVRRAYSLPEPVKRVGLRAFSGEIGVHMDRPTTVFSLDQLQSLLRG
ncbi:FAD-dependent oxidoreductase [Halosimplex pelagicum]|uniref:FAD-dependent monooxygenase n=1 Tax=Halosimplex pelagicum TaxID=869886 RepID=A0A7D5TXH3_9EURY|nr:FAD-dependent oxidoreductase [Halosimplex pelagicum]QLH84754.1 FAD-dependent monooxygenase [Halosimplex pelagicum]